MQKDLILIGGGGHCKSCINIIELEEKFNIIGILDVKKKIGNDILGYKYIGTDDDIESFITKGFYFLITIGQLTSAEKRKNIFERLEKYNANIATVISPKAHVSKHSVIGQGTIVMHAAEINAAAVIGKNCIINTGSNIEHDVVIGNHCHISTHAVLNGNCIICDNVFVGSNAVLSNAIELGAGIFIGAGSVVLKSLETNGTYAGNPARLLTK